MGVKSGCDYARLLTNRLLRTAVSIDCCNAYVMNTGLAHSPDYSRSFGLLQDFYLRWQSGCA